MLTQTPLTQQTFTTANTAVLWGSTIASNSTGIAGLLYSGSGGNAGSYTNITTVLMPIEIQYNFIWSTGVAGTTYVNVDGAIYGLTQYNGYVFSNSATFLLAPNKSFTIYNQNSSPDILLQTNSTIVITSLAVGPQGSTGFTGPTGTTGPIGQSAVLTQIPSSAQVFSTSVATIVQWGTTISSNSLGNIAIAYSAPLQPVGSFLNTTSEPLVIEIQYNLIWSTSIPGATYINVAGATYGLTQFSSQVFTNSATFVLSGNQTFMIYCQVSSPGVTLQTSSSIVITSLAAGPQGPQGPTGHTGPSIGISSIQNSITITGTSVSPTFNSLILYQINYRLLGDKYRVCYRFGWQSGTNGSGDYLVQLPSGISFNTNAGYNPVYTGSLWSPDVANMALYTIPVQGGIVQSSVWSTICYIIPYDSNNFRIAFNNNTINSLLLWSSTWYGTINGMLQLEFELWQ